MIIYIPDGTEEKKAIVRTTHLAISAHQDDIEFMAYAPIAECFGKADKWFSGIVVTDGAGSPRSGLYADYTDEEMKVTIEYDGMPHNGEMVFRVPAHQGGGGYVNFAEEGTYYYVDFQTPNGTFAGSCTVRISTTPFG